MTHQPTLPPSIPLNLRAILLGGLAAGALDIAAAIVQTIQRGGTVQRLFQAIASGWLGQPSYEGGWSTAALGLASHFMIATGAATVFVLAARGIPLLWGRPLVSGPLYGLCVWATMRSVVIPLSAFPHAQSTAIRPIVIAMLIHIFCVGLPIAYVTRAAVRGDVRRAAPLP